ncbi:MAG: phosphoribosyltransferase family protein [Cyclobacteriaceae bacterium]|nr:phosphoribosyltransferase family protein [Cyclobacteriaceae bacterium]
MEIRDKTNQNKVSITFQEITDRIKKISFKQYDCVIAIGSGGIVPGSLIAFHLNIPLHILRINFRNTDNKPVYDCPQLLEKPDFKLTPPAKVLLVDDVSVTGSTFDKAKNLLSGHEITTLAFKGKAEIMIFPEVATCVLWPWK